MKLDLYLNKCSAIFAEYEAQVSSGVRPDTAFYLGRLHMLHFQYMGEREEWKKQEDLKNKLAQGVF